MKLDADIWPIQVDVYFADDPDPTQPDEFAVTNTISALHFELRFRNDAPHFHNGPAAAHFDIAKFYRETVCHELGHVFSFAMNDEAQAILAKLFNTTVDGEFPPDKVWADRPGEAIAETFKDAFLPQSKREYSNRTNIHLNYPFFPLFRALYRNAVTDGMLRDAEAKMGQPGGYLGNPPSSTLVSGSESLAYSMPSGADAFRTEEGVLGHDIQVNEDANFGPGTGHPYTWFSFVNGPPIGPFNTIFSQGFEENVAVGDDTSWRIRRISGAAALDGVVDYVQMEITVELAWITPEGVVVDPWGLRFRAIEDRNANTLSINVITAVNWPIDGGTFFYEGVTIVEEDDRYGIDITVPAPGPAGVTRAFYITNIALNTNLIDPPVVDFDDLTRDTIRLFTGDELVQMGSQVVGPGEIAAGDSATGRRIRHGHRITGSKIGA